MKSAAGSRRQGLLGGVLVTLIAEAVALPAGLITAAVLARGLGPEIYGSFTVAASTVATLEWLLIAILARVVVKFVAEAEDWHPVAATCFRAYAAAGLIVGGATWLLAGPAAAGLGEPALARYFRLFAPQIPIFAVGAACKGILAGRGRYREQALASAVGWIARVLFIVWFVRAGYGITGAIVGSMAGTATGAVMALAMAGGAVWGRAGFPLRRLLQLALPAFLAMLFARLLDQVGILSLKAFGDRPAEVGYYGAAMSVLMVTSMVAAAVTPALVSTLTAARYRGDSDAVQQVATGSVRFGLVLFPFAAIVAGASPGIVALLFGPDFAPAAVLMALLIVGAIARANVVVIAAILVSVDRAWLAAAVALPLPVLALVAHAALIPRYGAVAAGWVSASLAVAGAVASLLVVGRVMELRFPVGTLLRTAVISATVYALAKAWPAAGLIVVVQTAVLALLVPAGYALLREIGPEEWSAIRRAIGSGASESPRSR